MRIMEQKKWAKKRMQKIWLQKHLQSWTIVARHTATLFILPKHTLITAVH